MFLCQLNELFILTLHLAGPHNVCRAQAPARVSSTCLLQDVSDFMGNELAAATGPGRPQSVAKKQVASGGESSCMVNMRCRSAVLVTMNPNVREVGAETLFHLYAQHGWEGHTLAQRHGKRSRRYGREHACHVAFAAPDAVGRLVRLTLPLVAPARLNVIARGAAAEGHGALRSVPCHCRCELLLLSHCSLATISSAI